METEPKGTMSCPICGKAEPHQHTEVETNLYNDAQIMYSLLLDFLPLKHEYRYDPQRSYGGRAMACVACNEICDRHAENCSRVERIKKLEDVLALIRTENFKLSNRRRDS